MSIFPPKKKSECKKRSFVRKLTVKGQTDVSLVRIFLTTAKRTNKEANPPLSLPYTLLHINYNAQLLYLGPLICSVGKTRRTLDYWHVRLLTSRTFDIRSNNTLDYRYVGPLLRWTIEWFPLNLTSLFLRFGFLCLFALMYILYSLFALGIVVN